MSEECEQVVGYKMVRNWEYDYFSQMVHCFSSQPNHLDVTLKLKLRQLSLYFFAVKDVRLTSSNL